MLVPVTEMSLPLPDFEPGDRQASECSRFNRH